MHNIKESIIQIIKKMPDDCSIKEIQNELEIFLMIEEGLNGSESNDILTDDEMNKELSSLLKC